MAEPATNLPNDPLTDHNYDGIREYDNPSPPWLNWLFWGTVFFSVFYMVYYHLGVGDGVRENYRQAVAAHKQELLEKLGELEISQADLLKVMNSEVGLAYGRSLFKKNCQTCHGPDGQGVLGPNLTDDHYKNAKSLTGVAEVIRDGVGQAMPPWSTKLDRREIVMVAGYVATLRGKNLSGRPPEGQVIDPWPEPPKKEAP